MTKDLKDLYITLPPPFPPRKATRSLNSLQQVRQTFFKIFTTNFWLKR